MLLCVECRLRCEYAFSKLISKQPLHGSIAVADTVILINDAQEVLPNFRGTKHTFIWSVCCVCVCVRAMKLIMQQSLTAPTSLTQYADLADGVLVQLVTNGHARILHNKAPDSLYRVRCVVLYWLTLHRNCILYRHQRLRAS